MIDRRTFLGLAALIALPVVFFGHGMATGQTLFYDDLVFQGYAWKAVLHRMASDYGHVSLWLPYEFSGLPHVADIQRQIFYPPNVVFYIMPTHLAMPFFVAFHLAAAGCAMYFFIRSLGLGCAASACGGLVYTFSAFPVLHLSQLPVLATYTWIPCLLLCVELYWRRPERAWGILAAGSVTASLMVLGGAPQIVYIGGMPAATYAAVLALEAARRSPARVAAGRLAGLAAIPLLALGLCALQLLPTAELASYSSRAPDVPSAFSTEGTAYDEMLASFIAPYAYGNPHESTWIGPDYEFHEACLYVGLVTLLLAAAALADMRRAPLRLGFFALAAALGLFFGFGGHLDWIGMSLQPVLSVAGKFRVSSRWMIWTVVGLAVLAAVGVEALNRTERSRRPALLAAGAAVVLACILLLRSAAVPTLALERAWPLCTLAIALALVAATKLGGRYTTAAVSLLGLLLTVELLCFASRYVTFTPVGDVTARLGVLQGLAKLPRPFRVISHISSQTPTAFATWCGAYGVANVQGSNPLFLQSYIEYMFWSQTGHLPDERERKD